MVMIPDFQHEARLGSLGWHNINALTDRIDALTKVVNEIQKQLSNRVEVAPAPKPKPHVYPNISMMKDIPEASEYTAVNNNAQIVIRFWEELKANEWQEWLVVAWKYDYMLTLHRIKGKTATNRGLGA